MTQTATFLAIDLGAASGRVMLGRWDGQRFELEELHRFGNGPVQVIGHMHWDVLRLWSEIKAGIRKYAAQYDAPLDGIGVDAWGVDFALLDSQGRLLGNPYHYRDRRTDGMPEVVERTVTAPRLFATTGLQTMQINTLFQLASMRQSGDPQLDATATLVMIPDLFNYWMTGRAAVEYTIASTTQFLNPVDGRWAVDLVEDLQLPSRILAPIVSPGTLLGELLPEVLAEVGLQHPTPVIAGASHDTASAVAAVPGLDERSMYISSGTWSLAGVEIAHPILNEAARKLNFTNEGGVGDVLSERRIRFLKNIGGLWLLQECRREWERQGLSYTWPDLLALAEQPKPLQSLVDPDAPDFLNPGSMPTAIVAYCRRTGQPAPESVGAFVRCCLESLALKYRWVMSALEDLLGRKLDTIRIVGGGSQNALLSRLAADACGRRVVAGPVEATALGNILVQALATGHLSDVASGRRAIAASAEQQIFEPGDSGDWERAYARFESLVQATGKQE
jgi:rhamnulokinase